MTPKKLPVWIVYARKSVLRTGTDLESPERQIAICESMLSYSVQGNFLTEVYQDLDRSGSTEAGRDEWLKAKAQLTRPEVVGVAAYSLDRIYRNVSEFLAFLNELEKHGKALKTARENLDTAGPLGRFVVTILMALYEMEWRLTSVRMADMIEHKRRQQGRHWGTAPFGTDRDSGGQLIPTSKTFTLDGDERSYYDALVQCFEVYAKGKFSYEQVATALNSDGWRFWEVIKAGLGQKGEYTPALWDSEKVRSVVNRWRLYQGDLPMGDPRKNHNTEWISGGHQPILSVELCHQVGEVVSTRNSTRWTRTGEVRRLYLLSDISHCYNCGMHLIGSFYKRRLYRHHWARVNCEESWTPAETVEAELLEAIQQFAMQDAAALIEFDRSLTAGKPQADLKEQITVKRLKLARLEDLYLSDGIGKESYLTRRRDILNELAELEMQYSPADTSDSAEMIMTGLSQIGQAEPKTIKALVSNIFERVEIGGGKIQRLVPQEWAAPFFVSCSRWAGWESNPSDTNAPILINWIVQPAYTDIKG